MSGTQILEWRHYTTVDGRGAAVLRRLEEHTFPLCEALGMRLVACGQDAKGPEHVHYVMAWRNTGEMLAGWKAFAADCRWQAIVAETEADGPLVASIERTVLNPGSRRDK
jgi:hypothetical protein